MAESPVLTPAEGKEESSSLTSCHDSPTKVTSSNTSSETASYGEEEHEAMLMNSLARQLEFYFSPANLPRDTYLQTLQALNDGYVPVSIIANFAKVQALCGGNDEDRLQAVVKAASDYTAVLEVVSISTVTNKRVSQDDANTILAVGPPSSTASAAPILAAPMSPIQKTIIIRDVPDQVKEEDIRGLFDTDKCPPLVEVRLDVANCWFVTLDTTSREDMMNVMLDLRSRKLHGESVKARLKSASSSAAAAATGYTPPSLDPIPPPPVSPPRKQNKPKKQQQQQPQKNNARGSRSRRKSGNNASSKDNNKPQQSPSSPKKTTTTTTTTTTSPPPPMIPEPPKLKEESHFPALVDPPVEVDNLVEKVEGVAASTKKSTTTDAASTTTTTSSTTSSSVQPGGYAAALLKAAPKVEPPRMTATATTKNAEAPQKPASSPKEEVVVTKKEEPKEEVPVVPLSWGSGRSFADVLKQEDDA